MTRFRNDFEKPDEHRPGQLPPGPAARINRLDSATTTSNDCSGAALSAPGTTNVHSSAGECRRRARHHATTYSQRRTEPLRSTERPSKAKALLVTSRPSIPAPPPPPPPSALALSPPSISMRRNGSSTHLNQIRRINLGPDQNDSSGYGLYLVRLPVSITPGECTFQGYGAELSVTVEHEFTPDFLPSAFQKPGHQRCRRPARTVRLRDRSGPAFTRIS